MDIPTTWIAVPTYWTRPAGATGPVNTSFDHPTPVDENGTLARTLESFRRLRGDFNVIVVVGTTHPTVDEEAHRKVLGLVKPFAGDYPIYLVSPRNLERFSSVLEHRILSLNGYGNIRNVQLALPYAAGAEVVIGIDDDEVIEDADFTAKAERFIGKEYDGDFVAGMAGPYYDRNGEYRIAGADELADEPNMFVKKNYFMNKALVQVMEAVGKGGIVRSNVAFGGNMCMHRSTISAVCHDPYIPRGEDYDYVMNAKMRGMNFYFRPDMAIVHLPPDSTGSQAGDNVNKLVADIRRFIYMREKYRYHRAHFPEEPLDMDYFLPYPGVYLQDDIDLEAEGTDALDKAYPDFRRAHSPEKLVADAAATARRKVREFFDYREDWRALTAEIDGNRAAAKAVESFRV